MTAPFYIEKKNLLLYTDIVKDGFYFSITKWSVSRINIITFDMLLGHDGVGKIRYIDLKNNEDLGPDFRKELHRNYYLDTSEIVVLEPYQYTTNKKGNLWKLQK